jgi:hypothetical protein
MARDFHGWHWVQASARARDLINHRADDLQRACGRLPELGRSLDLSSRTEQAVSRASP